MNGRQSRTLQALTRASAVVAAEATKSDGPPLLARMRADLDRSIERIHELNMTQLDAWSTLRDEPRNVEQLRRTIRRDRMMPLIKVARPLLKFAPGTAAALRIPHARASTLEVATAALRLADVLKKHAKLLASAGYSKQFIEEMREEARVLAAATKRNDKVRQRRSHATRAIAAEFKKARERITVIEGILARRLAADPAFEASWHAARRVTARTGRPTSRTKRRRALRIEESIDSIATANARGAIS